MDQAAQQADAANLIRRRRGYAATVLTGGSSQSKLGTAALMGNQGTKLGANAGMGSNA